jgi:uncharacterized protein (UPF0276 family)
MTPALFCNPSPALEDLVSTGQILIDGIEVTSFHSPKQIKEIHRKYRGLPFQLHASSLNRALWSKRQLLHHPSILYESRWISIHLSLVPSWVVYPALKFNVRLPIPSQEYLVKRMIEKVKRLKQSVALPLLLENMPVSPLLGNKFESEPCIIRDILQETGCPLLLDLAHARVAAANRGVSVYEYLEQLPLNDVPQLHISGTREKGGVLIDAHEPLEEADYDILDWVLARTHSEILTLEYYRDDKPALKGMLCCLRERVSSR